MEESIYPFALFALCGMKGREGADATSSIYCDFYLSSK
jgi:hypothetical protein